MLESYCRDRIRGEYYLWGRMAVNLDQWFPWRINYHGNRKKKKHVVASEVRGQAKQGEIGL